VLGAAQYDGRPSPQLAARLDHVLELWPRGLAPIVVVTGGKQPADRFTEAEAVAALLDGRGLRTVLLVTDPYHALRSRLIAEEVGLDAFVSPTGTSVVTGASSLARHTKEAAGVAVGRVVGFDRLRGLAG
jgi:uncharacterized SAM-binding protein YcdF (DUF218 family)